MKDASSPDDSAPGEERKTLLPGAVLDGRFRLVEPIGRGGFGQVFRAEELLPNGAAIRQVALKILSPESDLAAWADEAKLLASFSHPSLVTILAAGLIGLAGARERVVAPFVAMELLDGETLGAVLEREGAIPWRRVLAWARDVASALDVIHARGVVHLDLKPSNLFLGRDGSIKVLDFGIARRAGAVGAHAGALLGHEEAMGTDEFLAERRKGAGPSVPPPPNSQSPSKSSRPGSIVGTPGFMAPEVIEERPATPAADAYALAACIVHLATGALPQDVPPAPPKTADRSARVAWWSEVRLATSTGRIRDLEASVTSANGATRSLPRGVAALCKRLLALEPSARGVAPGGLRALVDAAAQRPFGVPDPPYLGLGAFGPAQEGMLFGRDDDVARLGRELADEPVLILQGVSGSGKSSLAMAGVVPELARRDAALGVDWRTVVVRPGVDPDAALDHALARLAAEVGADDPQKALAGAKIEAISAFARARGIGVAFVFDQLEELVTQAGPETRGAFLELLAAAALLPNAAPIRVVGTLREDFTSMLLAIEPLGERLRDALRFVGPPTMAAVRAIVAEPARLAGVRVEGLSEVAGEVERELRAGDGRLPLVSLALAAWWRTRESDTLLASEWARLGGVRAIFADLADGVFARLDDAAKQEARSALLELSGDGRARVSLSRGALRDHARRADAFDRAIDAFVAANLLVEAGGSIEIVHEFLFTAWALLEGWIADAQASRRLAAALREGARTWHELGRPVTRLPGDSEAALASLVLAEGGLDGADADLVSEWLGAKRGRERVERVRAAAIVAGVLSVLLIALGAWGKTISDAQARADQSKREARAAADEASRSKHEAELAAAKARENESRAMRAQADADRSRIDRERAAEEFKELLRNAESDAKKARIRCSVLERKERITSGGCPPGDPLCSSLDTGPVAPRPNNSPDR